MLLNVAGKPIIGHIMDKLIAAGIDEAIVIVGYLGYMVEEWLTKNYSIKFTFVNQPERLGLAHAIWMCRPHIKDDEPLLIILGDTIFEVDLLPVMTSTTSTLGVKEVDDPRRFGVAVTKGGNIQKLVEKPDTPVSNLAIVGLYFLRESGSLFKSIDHLIANEIKTKGEYQLTDALQLMIEGGEKFTVFPVHGWYDCGKPETLLSTNEILLQKGDQQNSTPDASSTNRYSLPRTHLLKTPSSAPTPPSVNMPSLLMQSSKTPSSATTQKSATSCSTAQ